MLRLWWWLTGRAVVHPVFFQRGAIVATVAYTALDTAQSFHQLDYAERFDE